MTNRTSATAVTILLTAAALSAGCSTTSGTTQSPPAAESSAKTTMSEATPPSATPSPPSTSATPSGPPVGTATMKMAGTGAGPVTIRYQINGGPEQVEHNLTLPWSKDYPVYNEVTSTITAEGAGQNVLTCSIIMDGKLLAFKNEPNASCSFAYWG